MGFLDNHNLLCVKQFDFRKGQSTSHALIDIEHKCLEICLVLQNRLGPFAQRLMLTSKSQHVGSMPTKFPSWENYLSSSVKCLGLFCIDEHLYWIFHVSEIAKKLRMANRALFKLCH